MNTTPFKIYSLQQWFLHRLENLVFVETPDD